MPTEKNSLALALSHAVVHTRERLLSVTRERRLQCRIVHRRVAQSEPRVMAISIFQDAATSAFPEFLQKSRSFVFARLLLGPGGREKSPAEIHANSRWFARRFRKS